MNAKLTLSMDRAVIASMKGYAAENNSSISQIVETFFKGLLSSQTGKKKISPLVQELSGIIPAEDDEHNDYVDYLEKNIGITAMNSKIGFIITRNVRDYKNPKLIVQTPQEYIEECK